MANSRSNFERIGPAFVALGRTLLELEATGDCEGAEKLLAEKGMLPPAVETALERLGNVPVDIRPRYTIVEKMAAW